MDVLMLNILPILMIILFFAGLLSFLLYLLIGLYRIFYTIGFNYKKNKYEKRLKEYYEKNKPKIAITPKDLKQKETSYEENNKKDDVKQINSLDENLEEIEQNQIKKFDERKLDL